MFSTTLDIQKKDGNDMKPRIVYIHGNQTSHWSSSWLKWLKPRLEERGFVTFFETFPRLLQYIQENYS